MGHYYKVDGTPCHKVPYADPEKGLRDTTIKDARKLNLLPSVTEILNILAKPGLENWKQQQTMLAALTLPRIDGEADDDLIKRIKQDAKEHAKEAADIGTAIHEAIHAAWDDCEICGRLWNNIARDVIRYIKELTGLEGGWQPETSHADINLGYGGTCDLWHPNNIILDYKTTEFLYKDGELKKLDWPERRLQLAGYAMLIFGRSDGVTGINIFIDYEGNISHKTYVLNDEDDEYFWHLNRCWQLQKNYVPKELLNET